MSTTKQYLHHDCNTSACKYMKYAAIMLPVISAVCIACLNLGFFSALYISTNAISIVNITTPIQLFFIPNVYAYFDVCTKSHPPEHISGVGVIANISDATKHNPNITNNALYFMISLRLSVFLNFKIVPENILTGEINLESSLMILSCPFLSK